MKSNFFKRIKGQIDELEWNFQKTAANDAVKNLLGVVGVSNNIKIVPEAHDEIEQKDIENALKRNSTINDKDITVKVSNHIVTITGDVKSSYDKDEAARIAWNLSQDLAFQVAQQLMAHDALGAHARDELGISEITRARPIQAALASAGSFSVGAAPPALLALILPTGKLTLGLVAVTIALLLILGGAAAKFGGASITKGAMRVVFWGSVAMICTALIGHLFGAII